MKAILHWIPGTDTYGLYVTRQGFEGKREIARADARGRLGWEAVEMRDTVEPTLHIPHELAESLREAFAGLSITDGSGLNFLRDAVATRDRLFTLVERLTEK